METRVFGMVCVFDKSNKTLAIIKTLDVKFVISKVF